MIGVGDTVHDGHGLSSYDAGRNTVTTRHHCRAVRFSSVGLDPVGQVRELLARHLLRPDGFAIFHGRRVERLVTQTVLRGPSGQRPPLPVSEVLVDPSTGELVASISRPFVGRTGQGLILTRFRSRTVLPATATNLALARLPAYPNAHHITINSQHC